MEAGKSRSTGSWKLHDDDLELNNICTLIDNSRAKRKELFIDSCFSGRADEKALIFEGVAPPMLVTNGQDILYNNFHTLSILTAGTNRQFANMYEEKGHRLFSYFLIRGLLTKHFDIKELYRYVRNEVSYLNFMVTPKNLSPNKKIVAKFNFNV